MLLPAPTFRAKLIQLSRLFLPITLTQLGLFGMSVVDTIMSGWAGTDDLAGVAIGTSIWFPAFLLLSGIFMALTPIVAHHIGSNADHTDIRLWVHQATYLAIGLTSLLLLIGAVGLQPLLHWMGLDPPVAHIALHYVIGLSFGMFPCFIAFVWRQWFDALGLTRLTTITVLCALPINALLNGVLILGWGGFPPLGGIGAGYASALTYFLLFCLCGWIAHRHPLLRPYALFRSVSRLCWQKLRTLVRIGLPIGLSTFVEASIFSVVTILIGAQFATHAVAATQVAISLAGLLFMLPLSITLALTIVVAYELGAGRLRDAQQYARIGVTFAVCLVSVNALLVLWGRETIATLYSDDPLVIALTMQLLFLVVLFQLGDALQSTIQGVLRGHQDTTMPFVITLVAYWLCGIPLGIGLASAWGANLGPIGYWIGITTGLFVAALGFALRLFIVYRRLR